MHNDINGYINYRLDLWADWYQRCKDNSLGYPSSNILARVKEMGGHYIKSTGPKPLPSNIEAEEIESLVREMHQQDTKMALALRRYYHTDNDLIGTTIKDFKMSHTQLLVHVNRARAWLAGRLSAKNKRERIN